MNCDSNCDDLRDNKKLRLSSFHADTNEENEAKERTTTKPIDVIAATSLLSSDSGGAAAYSSQEVVGDEVPLLQLFFSTMQYLNLNSLSDLCRRSPMMLYVVVCISLSLSVLLLDIFILFIEIICLFL
jgi:hypothetical protein